MDYKTILVSFARNCAQNGFRSSVKSLSLAAYERLHEWRYGITTKGVIHLDKVGLSAPGRSEYGAVDYRDFRVVMAGQKISENTDVFLDYGAGLGRCIILAATYPFRAVIGLELSEEFGVQAESNLAACRDKLACKDVRCVIGDATKYEVPDNVSFIFFNNPFYGDLLESVLAKIRESLERAPRKIVMICDLPVGSVFETQIRTVNWLALQADMTLPSGRMALIFTNRGLKL